MANRASAGSTVTFAAAGLGEVQDIRVAIGGDEIDVTRLGAGRGEYDAGQDDIEVTLTVVGNGAEGLSRGDIGDIVFTPNDGSGAQTYSNMVLLGIEHGAPGRSGLQSTLRFKPAYT